MFSVAYVILPFADIAPADAIRASLAPFQRAGPGDMPQDQLSFDDETDDLRRAHQARFTFTDLGERRGLRTEGGSDEYWYVDTAKVQDEMRQRGLQTWQVRFADSMDLDDFVHRFGRRMDRHKVTGGYGHWRNPLGRWDWWDLGGRFDGYIIGERAHGAERGVAQVSSGHSRGRSLLANVEDVLGAALGQPPVDIFDVRSDRNVELAATLLADLKAGRQNARPGTLVLPPGSVEDRLRWLDTWPTLAPTEAFPHLGLSREAEWPEVLEAAYTRFHDHWVAAIAYHL
jgi:hypothetical protein